MRKFIEIRMINKLFTLRDMTSMTNSKVVLLIIKSRHHIKDHFCLKLKLENIILHFSLKNQITYTRIEQYNI